MSDLQKITQEQMDAAGVVAAPDVLSGTASENKAIFDRMVRQLVAPAYNAAVDAINAMNQTESGIQAAEADRIAAEQGRVSAEESRASAEQSRMSAEEARAAAEQERAAAETERVQAESGREEAEGLRIQAEESRVQAETERASAEQARESAEEAREAAEEARENTTNGIVAQATAQAEEAAKSASGASASASQALDSRTGAETAAENAARSAGEAQASQESAAENAEAAQAAAGAAQTAAQEASGSAGQAASSAGAAEGSKEGAQTAKAEAETAAESAESWAVGGTGSRDGEDTDNAKYWAGQAQAAAGGGVVSFKGRSGAVEPQKGDYTAEQVGAIPQVNGAAGQFLGFTAANVVGAVDAPEGGGESKLIYAYSGAWSGNSYTISDSFFKKTGFVYLVCPMSIGTLADDYNDAGITINNVTTDDTLVINAANVPQTKNLVMVATRIPSTSSNGAVYYTNGFYIDVDALKQSITPTYNVVIDSSLNIPAGLMLGDVNQDGRITAADADIVQNSLVGGSLTPEQQELADMDGSGSINISDAMTIRNIANGATKVGAASKDITGVWSVNPDYAIEPAQFYVDIPLSGLTPNSNIALVTQGENASLVVKVEAMSGAFRVYATLLPISPIPYKLIQ